LRKIIVVSMLVLASCIFMVAQDNATKAEIFGGYQWTNVDDLGSGVGRQNFNGFNGAVTGYFNENLGITADFSGAFKTESGVSAKVYTYTFGPTIRVPMDKATPFVHALFGGGRISADESGTNLFTSNGFVYALGGGLDVNASKNVAIRIGQFDYLGSRFEGTTFKNFRYSAGIVFKF
jgi:opacity protein-like surface antigen